MPRLEHVRHLGLATTAIVAMLLTIVVAPQARAVEDMDAEALLVDLINGDRSAAGLAPMRPVADVRDVALAWSNRMADNRAMSHNPRFHEQFCCWRRAAENVGWTTVRNVDDSAAVRSAVERMHLAFMNSPDHRDNIMHPNHDHLGVGIEMRAGSCPVGVAAQTCLWVTENFRQWDGTGPAGGLVDPYAAPDSTPSAATVIDDIHPGGFDGNDSTVRRLGATGESSRQVSQARFEPGTATHAVLARDDAFPDSLAGTSLTADGPLLYTPTGQLTQAVAAELKRVLPAGQESAGGLVKVGHPSETAATVYLLGGPEALSPAVERAVAELGFTPVRLAGADRVATSLVVADEVRRLYGDTGTVVMARGWGAAADPDGPAGWVDSITGGAWAARNHVPILLSPTSGLRDTTARWLDRDRPTNTFLLGGTAALTDRVQAAVPGPVRIWGAERATTAAAVARQLWGVVTSADDREFLVIDGWARDGWRHGLAAAGLASDANAPVVLTTNDRTAPPPTRSLLTACDDPAVDLVVVGEITNVVASVLESFDGQPC